MRTTSILFALFLFPALGLAAAPSGTIKGKADPEAQLVLTSMDDGTVSGYIAKCDGTYLIEGLKPGRYRIQENGPHHVARELQVSIDHAAETDLAHSPKNICSGKRIR
jgi:hypothetical protein